MKKKICLLGLVFVLCLGMITGCANDSTPVHYLDDLIAVNVDMSVYPGFNDPDHNFKRVTLKEANRIYKEGGSGILYYGYSHCSWCPQAVPVMNEVAKDLDMTIYYIDVESDDGNTEESYNELISLTQDFLKKDENGKPSMYVPQVFVVKNGEIVADHLSTVDSYKPSQGNMTEKQNRELYKIYEKMFKKLK